MTGTPRGSDQEREVEAELRLAESSHPDEAMREPVADWQFDPTEVPRYEEVLDSLLAAVATSKPKQGDSS